MQVCNTDNTAPEEFGVLGAPSNAVSLIACSCATNVKGLAAICLSWITTTGMSAGRSELPWDTILSLLC